MKVRIASAGTGKTTSLVLRYLELIGSGLPLRRIAGVTFTRNAAAELRMRVWDALTELLERGEYLSARIDPVTEPYYREAQRELPGSTLTTIHGFVVDALRLVAPAMGLDPDFTTMPEWEAQALFEEEARSLIYLASEPEHDFHGAVSLLGPKATQELLELFSRRTLVERFRPDSDLRSKALVALFDAAYTSFQARLGARQLSSGEIERRALKLMSLPLARQRLAQRYRTVLVDEYQDVNPLQGKFFEALEEGGITVEVVGDPKQSVYGFRNADVGVFRRALANGERLPPLDRSYRHSQLVNRFLAKLTSTLGARDLGFSAEEAPVVEVADGRNTGRGHVEVHWVADDLPVARLREAEAQVLATRLQALHEERGIPFREMAVLARSHQSLAIAQEALERAGIPAVIQKGRGYFERLEIRDLYNALRAGVEPSGVPFAAWLRGPFGRMEASAFARVLSAGDPLAALAQLDPPAARRYERVRELVLLPPLEALKALMREEIGGGPSYLSQLNGRQRENVDALLLDVAKHPPRDMEVLLERLELQMRQAEAGDVPQTSDGVELLTVHGAKGLEWRVTAVFDLGRGSAPRRDSMRVDPEDGTVSLPGSDAFARTGELLERREEAESYRLLYVAASRPREILLLTGSVKGGRPVGWAAALELMGVGQSARPRETDGFLLARHNGSVSVESARAGRLQQSPESRTAEWLESSFPAHPFPPVYSPSRIEDGLADEPLPPSDGSDLLHFPLRAAAVGTLVHYAISQSWRPDDEHQMENLRAQEVMFPYSREEQDEIVGDVRELLGCYWSMLGRELPGLAAREVDEAELAMALPWGATVWQGVIDRLYRVEDKWYLDDYKTDRTVEPERYLAQLSLYCRAVHAARGVTPLPRLIYLRKREVVEISREQLEHAFEQAMAASVPL